MDSNQLQRVDGPHPDHDAGAVDLPEVPRVRATTFVVIGVGLVALLVALFALGWIPRQRRAAEANARTSTLLGELPVVKVVIPKRANASTPLSLPGTLEALQETTIYARTSGYLKKWYVDIGDSVKEGQLMALIDTPEVDQQLSEARAALAQGKANVAQVRTNLAYAKTSRDRVQALAPSGVASQQDVDQTPAAFHAGESGVLAAQAGVTGNQATIRRLMDMKAFSRVVAPFSGRVTSRTTEVGSLISAGNGTGQALFKIAQSDPVRIFVNTPQSFAAMVKVGQPAELAIREFPDRKFKGTVARTAQALDPTSHTLLTEVHVPNADQTLLTGTWAQVNFAVTREKPALTVPGSALIVTGEGPRVAIVGDGDKVHFQKVDLGIDYGTEVEIVSGLDGKERVVANPGQRLAEGIIVRVVAPEAPAPAK